MGYVPTLLDVSSPHSEARDRVRGHHGRLLTYGASHNFVLYEQAVLLHVQGSLFPRNSSLRLCMHTMGQFLRRGIFAVVLRGGCSPISRCNLRVQKFSQAHCYTGTWYYHGIRLTLKAKIPAL